MLSDPDINNHNIGRNNRWTQSNGIAVVIPVRNRSDLLEECLLSLAEQDFSIENFEVLVCDDFSTENLEFVVNRCRNRIPNIKLLRLKKHQGPAAARNMGFRSSKASIFVCVDSDVICKKDFLSRIIDALEINSDWVAAEATVFPKKERYSILLDAPENRGGSFLSSASAYRSAALKRVGGFDEEFPLPACEDAELAARLMGIGKYGYVAEAIVYHPTRRVSLQMHWRWRRHWRYEMILAKRYGFLAFPGHPAGRFPRLRVGLSAIAALPVGRLLEGLKYIKYRPYDGIFACLYAFFDIFCGLWAFPSILFSSVPPRRDYLSNHTPGSGRV